MTKCGQCGKGIQPVDSDAGSFKESFCSEQCAQAMEDNIDKHLEPAQGKKYELTEETKVVDGSILCRVKALRSFSDVRVGELGGWVSSGYNLAHEGNAWVYDDARVYESARVHWDASVRDHACVYGQAVVGGTAQVRGTAHVYGYARVLDFAEVNDTANVQGHAKVNGSAQVLNNAAIVGSAEVYGNAQVRDYARVYGDAHVYGNAQVYEHAKVCEQAEVYGRTKLYGNTKVYGRAILPQIAKVCGKAKLCGDAQVAINDDYLCLGPLGSDRFITAFKDKEQGVLVSAGCFLGTCAEFQAAVEKKYSQDKKGREYLAALDLIKLRFNVKEPTRRKRR